MDTLQLTVQAVARITELLAAKGWTKADLARATGIQAPHITRLMSAERATSLDTLAKVAEALGVHLVELFQPQPVKLTKVTAAAPGSGRRIPDLGRVAAGAAIDPKAEPRAWEEVWGLPPTGEFVIFTVSGDSMVGALIADGDRVIVRLQPTADSGDDVVCQIDGRLTLKTLHLGKGVRNGYWLLPHNETCDPIRVEATDDPRILGVLYEVRRKAKNGRRPKGKK